MTTKKILKKQRRRKDYEHKRNIFRIEHRKLMKGLVKGFSVFFPLSKKYKKPKK